MVNKMMQKTPLENRVTNNIFAIKIETFLTAIIRRKKAKKLENI